LSVAEGVCCRRSEDEEQFLEVSWLHVGAQGQRGGSRVIEDDAQGARPVLGLTYRGVSGQLSGGRIEVVRGSWRALPNLAGGATYITGLGGALTGCNGTVRVAKVSPAVK
jgi:hypothetical protein